MVNGPGEWATLEVKTTFKERIWQFLGFRNWFDALIDFLYIGFTILCVFIYFNEKAILGAMNIGYCRQLVMQSMMNYTRNFTLG